MTAPRMAPDQGLAVICQVLPEHFPKYPTIAPIAAPATAPMTHLTTIVSTCSSPHPYYRIGSSETQTSTPRGLCPWGIGFGFQSDESLGMPYTFFNQGDRPVAGMLRANEKTGDGPPHWLSYVSVEDLEASVETAQALGGTVLQPPMPVGAHGRLAVIQDPGGAVFSFWEFAKGG